ncbi:transcription antitermination factor NusB [Candidatus Roizmanbacteria bacterium]|nr:transcription antitermination factor NusB [Candidatus Roizmanbacteria bacterium]
MDTRHQRRIKLIQGLFTLSFEGDLAISEKDEAVKLIVKKKKDIDLFIKKYAPRYPLEKISKIDLAILRLAIYELIFERKNPPKVIIDEAVTLAREFGTERSYSFVNGVLGSIVKNYEV